MHAYYINRWHAVGQYVFLDSNNVTDVDILSCKQPRNPSILSEYVIQADIRTVDDENGYTNRLCIQTWMCISVCVHHYEAETKDTRKS